MKTVKLGLTQEEMDADMLDGYNKSLGPCPCCGEVEGELLVDRYSAHVYCFSCDWSFEIPSGTAEQVVFRWRSMCNNKLAQQCIKVVDDLHNTIQKDVNWVDGQKQLELLLSLIPIEHAECADKVSKRLVRAVVEDNDKFEATAALGVLMGLAVVDDD